MIDGVMVGGNRGMAASAIGIVSFSAYCHSGLRSANAESVSDPVKTPDAIDCRIRQPAIPRYR